MALHRNEGPIRPAFYIPSRFALGHRKKHFHDLHTDATVADIHLAAREGYRSVEHLKRYTTTGMGPDQGKTSNVNALAIMADILDLQIPQVGTTTFRPPYVPVTIGAVVGQTRNELYQPRRKTPMAPWHEAHGAALDHSGEWMIPRAYLRPGETLGEAVERECRAATRAAGLFDASHLGKIEVHGRDAGVFLDRVYTNEWSTLSIGRTRYGLMLNERGMIFDGGTAARLGKDHFEILTTSTGGAKVMGWLERWLQTEWTDLEVYLTDVSEQWVSVALWGARSCEVLSRATGAQDDGTLAPMACVECSIADVRARIFRTYFAGAPTYEVHVPARFGLHVWSTLADIGGQFGTCAIGSAALNIHRLERGFVLGAPEMDGTVTAQDLGLDGLVSEEKGDYIGRRSLRAEALKRADRKQLVGVRASDRNLVFSSGAHLVEADGKTPLQTVGRVVSSAMSSELGHAVTLALVRDGRQRIGDYLRMHMLNGCIETVQLTQPMFIESDWIQANE